MDFESWLGAMLDEANDNYESLSDEEKEKVETVSDALAIKERGVEQ